MEITERAVTPVLVAVDQIPFDAIDRIGLLVKDWGLPLVLCCFLGFVIWRLFFDYIRELKEALTRSEAGRERAEAERDEWQDAYKAQAAEINEERKGFVLPMVEAFNRIKKDQGDRGG